MLATGAAGLHARLAGGTVSAPLHEGARLLVQRRRTTVAPDALLWRVAGGSLPVIALLMLAVVPLGGRGPDVTVLADLPVGVVWFNAMDVLVWASLWLLGWGSNSLGALVGGYRFLAQALAYELPLMFALTTPAVAASSLRVGDVVASQDGLWNVVTMPVAFGVYLLCVLGFAFLGPLAQPASADVAGGVLAEPVRARPPRRRRRALVAADRRRGLRGAAVPRRWRRSRGSAQDRADARRASDGGHPAPAGAHRAAHGAGAGSCCCH